MKQRAKPDYAIQGALTVLCVLGVPLILIACAITFPFWLIGRISDPIWKYVEKYI